MITFSLNEMNNEDLINNIANHYGRHKFKTGNCALLTYYLNIKNPNIDNEFIVLYSEDNEVIHTAFSRTLYKNYGYDIQGKNKLFNIFQPYKIKYNNYYLIKYLFSKDKDYFLDFILPSTSYDISIKKELIDKRLQQTYLQTY